MATETASALTTEPAEALGFTGGLVCALNVTDYDRAVAWYRDVLGFAVIYELRDMGWVELQTPTGRVAVGLAVREQVAAGQAGATLTFGVRDIEAARRRLEQGGVRFDGETMVIEGQVKLATFFDPDGNTFMLYESESPEA